METGAHNRIRFRVMFFAVICFKLSACRGHTRAEMHFPDSVGVVVLFVVHPPLAEMEKGKGIRARLSGSMYVVRPAWHVVCLVNNTGCVFLPLLLVSPVTSSRLAERRRISIIDLEDGGSVI